MQPFRGVDYLLIDSLFNEQELLVRQTARQFVDDRLMPTPSAAPNRALGPAFFIHR